MPRLLRGLVLAGALLLAGCGVGGNDQPKTAEQPKITKRQLAAMVLPAEALGDVTRGLEPSDDSGTVDNAEAADDSLDPDDTAKTLKTAGRVTGHAHGFEYPKLVARKKGVYSVGSSVDLFEDPVYAAQFLHARLGDYDRFKDAVPGLKLSRYARFDAVGIGDEAGAQRLKVKVPGVFTGYVTEVYFRRGRIVASVSIFRADKQDEEDEALRLATELDRRVQGVLAGEIGPAPPSEAPSTAIAAAARDALPARTLAGEDIGPGVGAVAEERSGDEDSASYLRTFENVVVGGSHLTRLNAQTTLYEEAEAAAFAYRIATKPAGRAIFVDAVVKTFAKDTGVTPTNVRVSRLPSAGRGMTGVVVTFELAGTRFEMVSVFMRSGKLLQSVTGICRAEDVDPGDLMIVAERARARLTA